VNNHMLRKRVDRWGSVYRQGVTRVAFAGMMVPVENPGNISTHNRTT
jgi:hypothetical protein